MKTIGILGGMGPAATLKLAQDIMEATPAKSDFDHIPVIIDNNTQIPDRLPSILYGTASPLNAMITSMKYLAKRSDIIVMPCNTAHYFYDELAFNCTVEFINIIDETARFISEKYVSVKKVGLLGSDVTLNMRLYHEAFRKYGVEVITPSVKEQKKYVMKSIFSTTGVKGGNMIDSKKQFEYIGQKLTDRGADLIIAGCTEIPLVLKQENVSYVVVDPSKIVSRILVDKALLKTSKLGVDVEVKNENWSISR